MTELRRKFARHLILQRYAKSTNTAYMNAVKFLAAPFMVIMLIGLFVITYVPIISLWFPKLIYDVMF